MGEAPSPISLSPKGSVHVNWAKTVASKLWKYKQHGVWKNDKFCGVNKAESLRWIAERENLSGKYRPDSAHWAILRTLGFTLQTMRSDLMSCKHRSCLRRISHPLVVIIVNMYLLLTIG